MRRAALLAAIPLLLVACGGGRRGGDETTTTTTDATTSTMAEATTSTAPAAGCDGEEIVRGETVTCEVPGWPDRVADVHIPDGYDPTEQWPVVIAYHGGGGTREAGARTTCPDGDLDDPGCLHAIGVQEGFITVYPDGTSPTARGRFRTWNAGGEPPLSCAVGAACEQDVDDIAYTSDLLDMLGAHYSITERAAVTGLSNGGAMAHRAGCDLSEGIGVVVAFGGTNQQPGCDPSQPVSVLQVHGSDDPCWPYDGGELGGCLGGEAAISSVAETMDGWAESQDCAGSTESTLPDTADDGMMSEVTTWAECEGGAVVELVTVVGGGHTWPSGYSIAPRIVGPSTTDYNGSELLWEFVMRNLEG